MPSGHGSVTPPRVVRLAACWTGKEGETERSCTRQLAQDGEKRFEREKRKQQETVEVVQKALQLQRRSGRATRAWPQADDDEKGGEKVHWRKDRARSSAHPYRGAAAAAEEQRRRAAPPPTSVRAYNDGSHLGTAARRYCIFS